MKHHEIIKPLWTKNTTTPTIPPHFAACTSFTSTTVIKTTCCQRSGEKASNLFKIVVKPKTHGGRIIIVHWSSAAPRRTPRKLRLSSRRFPLKRHCAFIETRTDSLSKSTQRGTEKGIEIRAKSVATTLWRTQKQPYAAQHCTTSFDGLSGGRGLSFPSRLLRTSQKKQKKLALTKIGAPSPRLQLYVST
jgi:hypothetical protein